LEPSGKGEGGFDIFGAAEDKEFGVLVSFHYFKNKKLIPLMESLPVRPTVFTDSGGFSAHSQGASVDIDSYCSWLRRNMKVIDHYANLDVIGDWRGTLKNQLIMERRGFRPLPVLHYGTKPSEIRRYARHGFKYMCLGGLVPYAFQLTQALSSIRNNKPPPKSGLKIVKWIDECHSIANEEGVVLHGFGVTNWRAVTRYRWSSVDSSSWISGAKFGTLILFDPGIGQWVKGGRRTKFSDMMRISPLLREYGLPVSHLACDTKFSTENMIRATARSWLVAQRHLQRARSHTTRIFLAMINPEQVQMVFANAAQHASHGVDEWTS
jgi:hypothetical protein